MIGPNDVVTRRQLLQMPEGDFDAMVVELRAARKEKARRNDEAQRRARETATQVVAANEHARSLPRDHEPYGTPQPGAWPAA